MQEEGCRCGNDSPGRLGDWATAAAFALLVGLLSALPASGARAPDRGVGALVVVVHGQGRVTSEPAGAIDCPGDCSHTFTGSTSLTLRAAPATGWATAQNGFCGEVDVCTMSLNDVNHTIDVYFRPRAKLQVWPNGDGAITLSPTPADSLGEPDPTPCTPGNPFVDSGCERYYLPGTVVTASAAAVAASSFLGWSAHGCPGTGPCAVTLSRDSTSLVARFSPLEVRVIPGEYDAGIVVSEPAGISCPPTCTARFPFGAEVTLVARPDPAAPFLSWKFGCTPTAADPRRCVLTATNRPNWVGVALGEDAEIGRPATLSVLFDVTRAGQGSVSGRELDCGANCEHVYVFGSREELRATAASGWRFTGWNGACGKEPTCLLYVGPVTSVAAQFAENLAPQLLSVRATGKRAGRKLTVRLSVSHAASARLQLRRDGAARLLAERRYALAGGVNTLVLVVPAKTKPGRLRLTIAVTDGLGGGRTYTRVLRVGA
ncbi:MAG TPA: hypothetical protein VFV62_06680 [Gaiellaceae bacterium]|nr:hypothetical protein [Gaiellaceae bacterium]